MFKRTARFLCVVLLTATLGSQQAISAEMPPEVADSPLWWTLTDELTPQELYTILNDEQLHNQRYRKAIADGHRPPLPEKRVASVTSFLDGSLTPELITFWHAFRAFAGRFYGEGREAYLARAPDELAGYGLSEDSASKIISYAVRYSDDSQAVVERLRPEIEAALEILREVLKQMDRADFDEAAFAMIREANTSIGKASRSETVLARNAAMFAEMTGRDPDLVARLLHAWVRPVVREHIVPALRLLRVEIPEDEWERFRRFLFKEIAPQISTINFSE